MSKKKICHLSCAPMRREPGDKSEMVNQILFGETAIVLDENEKWFMIRLDHDGYEGWVDKKQLKDAAVESSSKFPVKEKFKVVDGIIIPCGGHMQEEHTSNGQSTSSMSALIASFLGSPYLWGGRTFMGIDCSGFTQIIYRSIGKSLPRDAYQQADEGQTISFIEECVEGDLAFFDNSEGRIIHVGIVAGKDPSGKLKIAHASGEVRIDYLDHQGIFNTDKGNYSHNLRLIKRL